MQKVEMSSEKRWHTFLIDLHKFLLTINFNSINSNLLFLFRRRFQILINLLYVS